MQLPDRLPLAAPPQLPVIPRAESIARDGDSRTSPFRRRLTRSESARFGDRATDARATPASSNVDAESRFAEPDDRFDAPVASPRRMSDADGADDEGRTLRTLDHPDRPLDDRNEAAVLAVRQEEPRDVQTAASEAEGDLKSVAVSSDIETDASTVVVLSDQADEDAPQFDAEPTALETAGLTDAISEENDFAFNAIPGAPPSLEDPELRRALFGNDDVSTTTPFAREPRHDALAADVSDALAALIATLNTAAPATDSRFDESSGSAPADDGAAVASATVTNEATAAPDSIAQGHSADVSILMGALVTPLATPLVTSVLVTATETPGIGDAASVDQVQSAPSTLGTPGVIDDGANVLDVSQPAGASVAANTISDDVPSTTAIEGATPASAAVVEDQSPVFARRGQTTSLASVGSHTASVASDQADSNADADSAIQSTNEDSLVTAHDAAPDAGAEGSDTTDAPRQQAGGTNAPATQSRDTGSDHAYSESPRGEDASPRESQPTAETSFAARLPNQAAPGDEATRSRAANDEAPDLNAASAPTDVVVRGRVSGDASGRSTTSEPRAAARHDARSETTDAFASETPATAATDNAIGTMGTARPGGPPTDRALVQVVATDTAAMSRDNAVERGDAQPTDQTLDSPDSATISASHGAAVPRASAPLEESSRALAPSERVQFLERLVESVRQSQQSGREMRVELVPPDLGRMEIRVTMGDAGLEARMNVETMAAHRALTENLPALRDALHRMGATIERIDVRLAPAPPQDAPGQDASSRHSQGNSQQFDGLGGNDRPAREQQASSEWELEHGTAATAPARSNVSAPSPATPAAARIRAMDIEV